MNTDEKYTRVHAKLAWGTFVFRSIEGLMDDPTTDLLRKCEEAQDLMEGMMGLGTPKDALILLARVLFRNAANEVGVLVGKSLVWEVTLNDVLESLSED